MSCIGCGRGFCDECLYDPCCCRGSQKESLFVEPKVTGKKEVTTSAGRKRAAVTYEINPELPCQWRGLTKCGGGQFPIIGCAAGFQQARHHGPVKDTTRNELANVHLVCAGCHNLWHAKNDPVYNEEEFELLPHKPRLATPDELLARTA